MPGPEPRAIPPLAQLALTVILFNQAANLEFQPHPGARAGGAAAADRGHSADGDAGRTDGGGTASGAAVVGGGCLAAVVAPTEVALIEALMDDRRIPERVRHALSVESGFYDGFALAILLTALGAGLRAGRPQRRQLGVVDIQHRVPVPDRRCSRRPGRRRGGVRSRRRDWMSDIWGQLAALALAFVCFAVGERMEASGFVAAFTGGLAFSFGDRAGWATAVHPGS